MKKKVISVLILGALMTLFASTVVSAGEWKKDNTGWKYQNDNGSYQKNGWKQENGKWYYFDSNGYMKTGWVKDGSNWYYLKSDGAMQTGWLKDGSNWYYLHSNGSMAYSTTIDGYKINASGAWISDDTCYSEYPSVPKFSNIEKVTYASQSLNNRTLVVNYYLDSSVTTDYLLRSYSELLSKQGFEYSATESHYTSGGKYENNVLVDSWDSYDKIVYYDKANSVKIVAEDITDVSLLINHDAKTKTLYSSTYIAVTITSTNISSTEWLTLTDLKNAGINTSATTLKSSFIIDSNTWDTIDVCNGKVIFKDNNGKILYSGEINNLKASNEVSINGLKIRYAHTYDYSESYLFRTQDLINLGIIK